MIINGFDVNPYNLAFKGVTNELSTFCGRKNDGSKGYTFNSPLGEWYRIENEKTVKCAQYGFHCARNPLDCYFNYGKVFLVEVGDDWDEEDNMLCATQIRFIKELDTIELVAYSIKFITLHTSLPLSKKVSLDTENGKNIHTYKDTSFILVKGKNPKVIAKKGTIVGMLKEKTDSSEIEFATIFIVGKDGIKAHKYYCAGDFKNS